MILTPLKFFRIPEPHARLLGYKMFEDYTFCEAEDIILSLRDQDVVVRCIKDPEGKDLIEVNGSPTDGKTLTIVGSDGESFRADRRALANRYHFFDDYYAAFPDEDHVSVPFPKLIVTSTISRTATLNFCYECLSFLNPKSNIHYFILNTKDANKEILSSIADRLTTEERVSILEATRYRSGKSFLPLPYEGMGLGILAPALLLHDDDANLLSLFQQYPSYLFCNVAYIEMKRELAMSSDFSREIATIEEERRESIIQDIILVLALAESWEEVKRCLTMLGIKRKKLGNLDDHVALPYNIVPYDDVLQYGSNCRVSLLDQARATIARLGNLAANEVRDLIIDEHPFHFY